MTVSVKMTEAAMQKREDFTAKDITRHSRNERILFSIEGIGHIGHIGHIGR